MAKAILVCGKICSGKTTYAKSLIKENPAVLLSVDEITIILYGPNGGEEHDLAVEKTQKYLLNKSLEIIGSDINVILDWGFWTKEDRREVEKFYKKHGVTFEWHYIDASDAVLRKNLNERNQKIKNEQILFYYFDNELANRFWKMFEIPTKGEMDIWIVKTSEPLNQITNDG